MLKYKCIFQIRCAEAILSNSTLKLLWFEITKMVVAVKKINLLCHYWHTYDAEILAWRQSCCVLLVRRKHGGLHVLLLFLVCLFFVCLFILNDLCQTSYHRITTGPIFAKFSEFVELWLEMNNLKLVFDPSMDVAMVTNFCRFYPRNWFAGRRRLVFCFALHLVFLMLPVMLTCRCTSQLPARRCASVGTDCGPVSVCVRVRLSADWNR